MNYSILTVTPCPPILFGVCRNSKEESLVTHVVGGLGEPNSKTKGHHNATKFSEEGFSKTRNVIGVILLFYRSDFLSRKFQSTILIEGVLKMFPLALTSD